MCFLIIFNLRHCVAWEEPFAFTDPYLTDFTWRKLNNVTKLVVFLVGLEKGVEMILYVLLECSHARLTSVVSYQDQTHKSKRLHTVTYL